MKIGFDNEKYLKIQSEHIKERISQFDGKLYLELGGKLFDDHHASDHRSEGQPDNRDQLRGCQPQSHTQHRLSARHATRACHIDVAGTG